jgi:hypothetical protein
MFLDGEWSRVQGERAAKDGNAISRENPLQELAHRESYYLDEKNGDEDEGNLKNGKYNNKSEYICKNTYIVTK